MPQMPSVSIHNQVPENASKLCLAFLSVTGTYILLGNMYIALIRPNHWAASVAQRLEHLPSKQCVAGSNPTRAALFFFSEKK